MNRAPRIPALVVTGLALVLLLSCCRKNAPQRSPEPPGAAVKTQTSLVLPKANTVVTSGDPVQIEIQPLRQDIRIDSIGLVAGKIAEIILKPPFHDLQWSSEGSRVGQTTLRVWVYYNDSLRDAHTVGLVILSDIVPKTYQYRVIRQYPHDDQAYTQGLFYDAGVLYESTGLEGKSSIRIVDIASGKPLKKVTLAPQYFAEGIALMNDQVYQITYKSQIGFIYQKETLELVRSFDYPFREGWGLTTDGENLIMTDGSAQLYIIDPEYYAQIDRIEVMDNKGLVDSLNEIEMAQGKILANIYGESQIILIDPSSGKVTGRVDLDALMPEGSRGNYNKVLNGIAYNPQNGHLYVTGKNWPVLYEIELIPSW